ncbi:DUF6479 family protein [Streptomyces monticola]|uniref:DUF6479 family protein n=1 Tax=Streptomyces monticola TaxID=2666263 RepID=A0ABW2JVC6_9ACTN
MTAQSIGNDTALHVAANAFVGGIAPFLVGLIVAGALIWAVWLGLRVRRREPGPPRPEEQPRLPDGGPVGDVSEVREPDEVPRDQGRLMPHELKGDHAGSRRSGDQSPRRWSPGSSGAFGSGGPGKT